MVKWGYSLSLCIKVRRFIKVRNTKKNINLIGKTTKRGRGVKTLIKVWRKKKNKKIYYKIQGLLL